MTLKSTLRARTILTMTAAVALVMSVALADRAVATHLVAHVNNPMSMSNTTAGPPHSVYYFVGWTNRFSSDLNSPDEYPDAPIYLFGSGWSTAMNLTGSNAPLPENVWAWVGGTCTQVGTEYANAFALNLSNGQTAGFAIGHLSNYHVASGSNASNGQQVANLSWLSNGRTTYKTSACSSTSVNSTAPHIHAESARTGSTSNNALDPVSGPSYYPYWYYVYH